jgi:hypothetical protein
VNALGSAFWQIAPVVATGEQLAFLQGDDDIAPIVETLPADAARLRRLKTIARWLSGDPFMLSYGSDGLGMVVTALAQFVYEYLNLILLLCAGQVGGEKQSLAHTGKHFASAQFARRLAGSARRPEGPAAQVEQAAVPNRILGNGFVELRSADLGARESGSPVGADSRQPLAGIEDPQRHKSRCFGLICKVAAPSRSCINKHFKGSSLESFRSGDRSIGFGTIIFPGFTSCTIWFSSRRAR